MIVRMRHRGCRLFSHRNVPNLVHEDRRLLALLDSNVFTAGATCANRRVESL